MQEWERWKKKRYRVEALFGAIKLKVGCGLNFVNEDMARKAALAVAVLWNFYMLVVYLFLSVCSWCIGGRFMSFSLIGFLIQRGF